MDITFRNFRLGQQVLPTFTYNFYLFRHAKRSTVNVDDVKLLARRNPKLVRIIKTYIEFQLILFYHLNIIREDFR